MLTDRHGRQATYLRLAVTDRCNLRCRYCMPAEGADIAPRGDLLSYEEILRLADVLAGLGVTKVRLTGGEPLLRKDIEALVGGLAARFEQVAMTTNAALLQAKADGLLAAGLSDYNVSLDTLRPERFRAITRRDAFAATWAAIDDLLARGLLVKLNCVVMRGVNDDEIGDFVALTRTRRLEVRFIEAMPFNDDDGNRDVYLSAGDILGRVRAAYPEVEPRLGLANSSALHYGVPGHVGTVGVIPAYSRALCGQCNRLRLTPTGTLLNCLYATRGLELRSLLRAGTPAGELSDMIRSFVLAKHADGHATERLEQAAGATAFASMTGIGG